ncbi:MAG: DUF951 family protein [Clostridia bacterium]|nr:DUF951 family protein [Clostridia bacterium]
MALDIKVGDTVTLKKKHPCGGFEFKLIRVGAECKGECCKCGGIIEMPRRRFEVSIKSINNF